jgi:hypothetical protein
MPQAGWLRAFFVALFSWTGFSTDDLEGTSLGDSGPGMDPNG